MIHRVYICANLNFPFVVQDSNQLNESNTTDIHMPSIPMLTFISTNLLQDRVEKDFLVQDHVHSDQGASRISFEYNWCRRRLFFQEGDDDEDMTSMYTAKYGEWHEDEGDLQGFPSRVEGPKLIRFESPRWRPKNNSSSSPPRSPRAARTKNDAQVAHGVYFGRSLYRWKDNFKELPMAFVSGPNSLGVNRNSQNNMTSRIC